jgi:hypothetical protein
LPTVDGGVLRTIGDAITYMTALGKAREMQQTWQHACKLILSRAPVKAITCQLSLALFMDVRSRSQAPAHQARMKKAPATLDAAGA